MALEGTDVELQGSRESPLWLIVQMRRLRLREGLTCPGSPCQGVAGWGLEHQMLLSGAEPSWYPCWKGGSQEGLDVGPSFEGPAQGPPAAVGLLLFPIVPQGAGDWG